MRLTYVLCSVMVVALVALPARAEDAAPAGGTEPKAEAEKPTHKEIGAIGQDVGPKFKKLANFTMDAKGNLLCCDQGDGTIKGRVQMFKGKTWTVPTLSGGLLFVRDENEMVALKVTK